MSFSFSSVNSNYTKFTSVATITSSVTISNTTPSTIVVQGNSSIVNITIPSSINVGSKFTIISNYSLGDNTSYPDQRATFIKTSSNGNIARLRFNDQVTVTALQSTPTQPRHFASKIVRKAVSSSITKWTTFRTSSTTHVLYGVKWSPELGLFCACSSSRMITSPDGINWTSRTVNGGSWYAIEWSPELGIFCSTSLSGNIATSPDSITWTTRSTAGSRYENLVWSPELGLFCATANNDSLQPQIVTSPDGITWTTRSPGLTTSGITAITWSPQLSLFVAFTQESSNITSPDGITWSSVTSPTAFTSNSGITWSPELGLFCAVANTRIYTSPDGTTWTTRNTSSGQWFDVQWVSQLGIFVVISIDNTSPKLISSPNGITWTSRLLPSTNTGLYAISWSPELNMMIVGGSPYDSTGHNVLRNTW